MDPSHERALAEQLAREIMATEKIRARIIAVVFSLGFVLATIVFHLVSPGSDAQPNSALLKIGPNLRAIVGVFSIYCWISYALISRKLTSGKPLPSVYVLANTVVEVSSVTALLWMVGHFSSVEFAMSAPPILIYLGLVMLSILRLSSAYSLFVAGLCATQYLLFGVWSLSHLRSIPDSIFSSPVPVALRTSILIVCGLGAAMISRDLRARLMRTAEAVLDRDRTVAMFGQHVSPQVAERLLKTHAGQVTETRQVCILFFDIRDFTRYAEGKTPSEVVRYLNTLFGPLVEIVDQHGGIINKFLGDGFLAIFGAPIADEAHCLSATRAALAMIAKVDALCAAEAIPKTRVGIGLHAGPVVTGSIGSQSRREYTVIGDTVNLAARVEQQTKNQKVQILATEAVVSQLPSGEFPVQKLDPIHVKGREESVQLYKLA